MPVPNAPRALLIDGLAANFGGTAYAGVQVARALAARDDVSDVVVAARPGSIIDRGLRGVPGVQIVSVRARPRAELLQRAWWEATALPDLVRSSAAEGVLVLSGMLPRSLPCPVVGLQANPTVYEDPRSLGAWVRRTAVVATGRRAAATYVPSRHVEQLADGVPRCKVVPLGVDRAVFAPPQVPGRDLLCVADFYEHKRHDLLLDAYAQLPAERPTLRLIGNPAVAPDHFAAIQRRAASVAGVEVLGRVSFEVLIDAYRRARLFLMASERESFCMPVAEALACGVPVLANDIPSLRETAGPGGRFVAGDDPAAWSAELDGLLRDNAAWSALRTAGLEHVERFSWDAFAATLSNDLAAA